MTANPLNPVQRLRDAPRCTATSKRTGAPCKAPAMRGWSVCRFHGARGGAPQGAANGAYTHGGFTKEAVEDRRRVSALLRACRAHLHALGGSD